MKYGKNQWEISPCSGLVGQQLFKGIILAKGIHWHQRSSKENREIQNSDVHKKGRKEKQNV